MKKITVQSSFIDFKGNTRMFTVCGCFQSATDIARLSLSEQLVPEEPGFCVVSPIIDVTGVFSVGLSVCHENDTFDPIIGAKRAEGRAEKVRNCAFVMPLSNKHVFTHTMMNHVMQDIVEDIKRAPGKYIPGYNSMEIAWIKKQKADEKDLCPTNQPSTNN